MSLVNVSFTLENAEKIRKALQAYPSEARKAVAAAVNRSVNHARTEISKAVRKNYRIKAGVVKGALTSKRANASRGLINGVITATGAQLPLIDFYVSHASNGPLTVRVKKSGGGPVPGLFWGGLSGLTIRRDRSGNITRRLPVKNPGGPSVPQMVENEQVWAAIEASTSEYLNQRVAHELAYRLSKMGG